MNSKNLVFIVTPISLVVGVLVTFAYSFMYGGCELDRGYAHNKVIEHLGNKGMDIKYLVEDREKDTDCSFSYVYNNESESINFKIINGYKLTWWNCNERGEAEACEAPVF